MKFIKKVGDSYLELEIKKLSDIPCHEVLLLGWGGKQFTK